MILSVIIPLFNSENHVGNCLNSLLNQNMPVHDYEIIIINDGSTDQSPSIVEDFQKTHKNIQLVNQNNQGCSMARNTGMKLAQGDYIYFMDADDYIAQDTFIHILEAIKKSKADIITFDAVKTDRLDLTTSKYNHFSLETTSLITGLEYMKHNPKHRVEVWWYLVKRSFLQETGLTFKKGMTHQDVMFTLTLFLEAKTVLKLPIDVYRYYQSEGSQIRSKHPSRLKKIIDDYVILFEDMQLLITDLKSRYPLADESILNNIKFRKKRDAFFAIIRMIRAKLTIKNVDKYLCQFSASQSYPIPFSVAKDHNHKMLYYFLITIVNYKILLYPALVIYRMVK